MIFVLIIIIYVKQSYHEEYKPILLPILTHMTLVNASVLLETFRGEDNFVHD